MYPGYFQVASLLVISNAPVENAYREGTFVMEIKIVTMVFNSFSVSAVVNISKTNFHLKGMKDPVRFVMYVIQRFAH